MSPKTAVPCRLSWCPSTQSNIQINGKTLILLQMLVRRGFGPDKEGNMARVLTLILWKGRGIHKDNFSTDKQVGSLRHWNYFSPTCHQQFMQ
jgi:hypothetical protein